MTTTTTRSQYGYSATAPINVWVGNLRKYNEGELSGEWVALPVADVDDVFDALGIDIDRDEYHIPDWECEIPGLEYFEYADLGELNRKAEELISLDDWQRNGVGVRMALLGEDFDEALRHCKDVRIWHGCTDMADVAQEYCEESGVLDQLPDNLRYYFDFEAFGRDMEIEGYFEYMPEHGCMVEAY